jgi:predicted RND superfamily exporter protein
VVDDTVHFLTKYLRARREMQLPPREAIDYSFRTVGVALMQTTVALALGFAVLAQSGFAISADMGLLSAIVIVVALLADLLVLPPLLLLMERSR